MELGYSETLMADFEYVVKSVGQGELNTLRKIRDDIDIKIKELEENGSDDEESGAGSDGGEENPREEDTSPNEEDNNQESDS